jgi:hypothetical protein
MSALQVLMVTCGNGYWPPPQARYIGVSAHRNAKVSQVKDAIAAMLGPSLEPEEIFIATKNQHTHSGWTFPSADQVLYSNDGYAGEMSREVAAFRVPKRGSFALNRSTAAPLTDPLQAHYVLVYMTHSVKEVGAERGELAGWEVVLCTVLGLAAILGAKGVSTCYKGQGCVHRLQGSGGCPLAIRVRGVYIAYKGQGGVHWLQGSAGCPPATRVRGVSTGYKGQGGVHRLHGSAGCPPATRVSGVSTAYKGQRGVHRLQGPGGCPLATRVSGVSTCYKGQGDVHWLQGSGGCPPATRARGGVHRLQGSAGCPPATRIGNRLGGWLTAAQHACCLLPVAALVLSQGTEKEWKGELCCPICQGGILGA